MEDYAIVKTGGKQYRVQNGDVIRVESLPAYRGDVVELSEVLMASRDDAVFVGQARWHICHRSSYWFQ